MGSNQHITWIRKVLTTEEVAINREEAKQQWERREIIQKLNCVGALSSTVILEEENNEDTMMDVEVQEENIIEENSGLSSNPVLDIGMSWQINVTYSDEELDHLLDVCYNINDLNLGLNVN